MLSVIIVLFFPVYVSVTLENKILRIRLFGVKMYEFDFAEDSTDEDAKKGVTVREQETNDDNFNKLPEANLKNITDVLKKLYRTLSYVREKQQDLVNQIRKIVRIKLRIEFGTGNPYQTGMIRASLFFTLHTMRSVSEGFSDFLNFIQLDINTNFIKKVFNFNGKICFNFNICQLIYVAVKLRSVIKHYKKQIV